MIDIKEQGVLIVYRNGEIAGFFIRDEKTKENIFLISTKAGLEDIKNILSSDVIFTDKTIKEMNIK